MEAGWVRASATVAACEEGKHPPVPKIVVDTSHNRLVMSPPEARQLAERLLVSAIEAELLAGQLAGSRESELLFSAQAAGSA